MTETNAYVRRISQSSSSSFALSYSTTTTSISPLTANEWKAEIQTLATSDASTSQHFEIISGSVIGGIVVIVVVVVVVVVLVIILLKLIFKEV